MKLIGIAGKTGAGKNYIAELLEQRGWRTLDLDLVAHKSLEALSLSLGEQFGPDIFVGGKIDRKELGRRVFSSPSSLQLLENMTYPWIEEQTRRWIAEDPEAPAAIHAINLHKTSLVEECDLIIWVTAPSALRKKRVMVRENRAWKELKGRFRSQNGLNSKLFSSRAEIYSVRNSGNVASLNASLDRILHRL